MNAPGPIAGARRSRLSHDRSRIGKSTNHRRRTDPSSAGRTPRRRAGQGSPAGSATHDVARGSRNRVSGRFPPHPAPQSRGRRTGSARAIHPRRDIEARRDRQICDPRRRDAAERAIRAARGDGYASSRAVNGIRYPGFKRNRPPSVRRRGPAKKGADQPRKVGGLVTACECEFRRSFRWRRHRAGPCEDVSSARLPAHRRGRSWLYDRAGMS